MIEKIEIRLTNKEALLAILVAKTNELIEAANNAEKKVRSEQSSWD